MVLADGEQFEAAIACYREALARVPDDAVAHNNLGRALYRLGRLDEAIAGYRQTIGLKPDYAEALNNLGSRSRSRRRGMTRRSNTTAGR